MRQLVSYSFVLPPTVFIVISFAGALIALIRPRVGTILVLVSSLFLYLFATPAVSMLLKRQLVSLIPTKVDFRYAQAIVVPGVDIELGNGADIPDSVGLLTLERLASAAELYRRLRLPIVVSGGSINHSRVSLANLMRHELEDNFSVPVQFTEENSHNTFENALYTSELLRVDKLYNVIIVAQARDMPRLLWSFDRVGCYPIPFAVNSGISTIVSTDFFPSSKELLESFYEIHEILGLFYYKIFY